MNGGFRAHSMPKLQIRASRPANHGRRESTEGHIMNLRTTALVAGLGLVTAIGAGAAIAQPSGQGAPYANTEGAQYGKAAHRHFGAVALIREEMKAGRISQREGSFLVQKIRELHAQRREQRQAYQGRGMNEGAPPRTQ
jgi:hypothetical protein